MMKLISELASHFTSYCLAKKSSQCKTLHTRLLFGDSNSSVSRYLFECNNWLAVNKGDGQIRRTLVVSSTHDVADSTYLMKKNMSQRIFEDHMWLSVGFRTKKSLFTRAQRLGACLATLFLAMITNALFFKDASEKQPSPMITIGPLAITGPQLYNSIISSLIAIPAIVLMTVLFSKAKPKPEPGEVYQNPINAKKGSQFPHWCSYIGWVLVFIYIVVSGVFTIFYSMSWGREKSIAWVQTFVLSFAESAILIQPIKVCGHSTYFVMNHYCLT